MTLLDVNKYKERFSGRHTIRYLFTGDFARAHVEEYIRSTGWGMAYACPKMLHENREDNVLTDLEITGLPTASQVNRVCRLYSDATGGEKPLCKISDQIHFRRCYTQRKRTGEVRSHHCWLGFREYLYGLRWEGEVQGVLFSGEQVGDAFETVKRRILTKDYGEGLKGAALERWRTEGLSTLEAERDRQERDQREHRRIKAQDVPLRLKQLGRLLEATLKQLIDKERADAANELLAEANHHLAQDTLSSDDWRSRCASLLDDICHISGLLDILVFVREHEHYRMETNRRGRREARIGLGAAAAERCVNKRLVWLSSTGNDRGLRDALCRALGDDVLRSARMGAYWHNEKVPFRKASLVGRDYSVLIVLVGEARRPLAQHLRRFCQTVSVRLANVVLARRLADALDWVDAFLEKRTPCRRELVEKIGELVNARMGALVVRDASSGDIDCSIEWPSLGADGGVRLWLTDPRRKKFLDDFFRDGGARGSTTFPEPDEYCVLVAARGLLDADNSDAPDGSAAAALVLVCSTPLSRSDFAVLQALVQGWIERETSRRSEMLKAVRDVQSNTLRGSTAYLDYALARYPFVLPLADLLLAVRARVSAIRTNEKTALDELFVRLTQCEAYGKSHALVCNTARPTRPGGATTHEVRQALVRWCVLACIEGQQIAWLRRRSAEGGTADVVLPPPPRIGHAGTPPPSRARDAVLPPPPGIQDSVLPAPGVRVSASPSPPRIQDAVLPPPPGNRDSATPPRTGIGDSGTPPPPRIRDSVPAPPSEIRDAFASCRVDAVLLREAAERNIDAGNVGFSTLLRFFFSRFVTVELEAFLSPSSILGNDELAALLRNLAQVAHHCLGGVPLEDATLEAIVSLVSEYVHNSLDVPQCFLLDNHLRLAAGAEPALHAMKGFYRDHFFHTLQVCFLGHFLLELNLPARAVHDSGGQEGGQVDANKVQLWELVARVLKLGEGAKAKKAVLRGWYLSALLHDIGYVIDLQESIQSRFRFFHASEELQRFETALENAVKTLSADLKNSRYPAEPDPGRDHGIIGAVHLRALRDEKRGVEPVDGPEYEHAIAAIAVHNSRILHAQNGEHRQGDPKAQGDGAKPQVRVNEVSFEENPLGVLLIVCDSIQESERVRFGHATAATEVLGRIVGARQGEYLSTPTVTTAIANIGYRGKEGWELEVGRPLLVKIEYRPEIQTNSGVFNVWLDATCNLQRLGLPDELDLEVEYITPLYQSRSEADVQQLLRLRDAAKETHMGFLERWLRAINANDGSECLAHWIGNERASGQRTEHLLLRARGLSKAIPKVIAADAADMREFRKKLQRWKHYNDDFDFRGDYAAPQWP